jgi:hypothetical protein
MARWRVFGFTCWEPEGSLRESVAYSQVQTTRQHTPIEFSAPTGSDQWLTYTPRVKRFRLVLPEGFRLR